MLRVLAAGTLLFAATAVYAAQAVISGVPKIYLRAGPSADQPSLAILSEGDSVDIIDIEGSWTKVQTTDGKTGYVYHRYVLPKVATESGAVAGQPLPAAPLVESTRALALPASSPRTASAVEATAEPLAPAPAAPVAATVEAPAAEKSPTAELSAEVASLRAEIADLKEKVQNRQGELAAEPSGAAVLSVTDGSATPISPAATPPTAPVSRRDQAVGVLMIAAFSLVIGWVLGSTFGRRGSRSRSGRLRF
jgi:uncharacterized protein YgiM (DUF1202 family)